MTASGHPVWRTGSIREQCLANLHHNTPSGLVRARGAGIPFEGSPGPINAITDVSGVEVGYVTLIDGDGQLIPGQGPVRTGVTAILPRGRAEAAEGVFAGYFSLNGYGELTGSAWIEESGRLDGPITITNTHSCGLARDATIRWLTQNFPAKFERGDGFALPVAAETYDGYLNDINGFHVRESHVFEAIESARSGPVEEGSVGGGTGMKCYQFKAGSGTASRRVRIDGDDWTVAAFVQANFGLRHLLTIAGVPVGRHLPVDGAEVAADPAAADQGSIIAVIATDAPLMPHQLTRLARRCGPGIARSGAVPANESGDLFVAFSTANTVAFDELRRRATLEFLPDFTLSPLFEATVQSVDEAVLNSLFANRSMTGRDGHTVPALSHSSVRSLMRQYGRLEASPD
jgi:L-aminopeptidase/D-esterase-like protein